MRILVILMFFVVLRLNEVESKRVRRVASGFVSSDSEEIEFCYLTINFYQKQQTCGCFIWNKLHVVTSARCVVDCSEKVSNNITVTFPYKTGAERTGIVTQVFLPDGVLGDPIVPKYDETKEVPSTKFVGDNFAVLRLQDRINTDDGSTVEGEPYTPWQETITEFLDTLDISYGPNVQYRVCGVGAINNKGDKPKKDVICARVDVIDPASGNCKSTSDGTVFTPPEGFFCVQWRYGENNMCAGDFGGPIYAYTYIDEYSFLEGVIGIAIGSPDIRSNSQCQDGHTIFAQFLTVPVQNFIYDIAPDDQYGRKRIILESHTKRKLLQKSKRRKI